eukprot:gene37232-50242_t
MVTVQPSLKPKALPTVVPRPQPTSLPQYYPSIRPTTKAPTRKPTRRPTIVVTAAPTIYFSCQNKDDCGTHPAVLALPDPASDGHINNAAFKSIDSLTTVLIDVTVVSIGIAVFVDCTSLSSVIVPTTVTEIGSSSFQGCTSLRTIQLPTSLTYLPDFMFQLSGLVSIVIPTTVGQTFFATEQLSSVVIPTSIMVIPRLFCSLNTALQEIVIPSSVSSIEDGAFVSCVNLACIVFISSSGLVNYKQRNAFVNAPLARNCSAA